MANSGLGRLQYSARELYAPDEREPADTECEHGSVIWLHIDPERGLCGPDSGCDQASVALIDVPSIIGQKIALCEFHLARFAAAQPDVAEGLLEASQFTRDDADVTFVTLDDVPPKLRNGRFERIGLDRRGEAHYQRVREAPRLGFAELVLSKRVRGSGRHPRSTSRSHPGQ